MLRTLGIGVAVAAAAACGGGDGLRPASDGVFSCRSDSVRVEFDPASGVSVAAGGDALARATFTERHVSEDCDLVRGAPKTTMEESPYDDRLLANGRYRRANVDCTVAGGVRIYVHPIFNADIGRNDGSVLLVVDGRKIVVSAVLKNKGDPQASRVYHAPRYCTAS